MDIIGDNSLCDYSGNALITATTAVLIILGGGLGYIVWWDAARVIKNRRQNGGRFFKSLTLHSKIVRYFHSSPAYYRHRTDPLF